MIGVIQKGLVFEFNDDDTLCRALSIYADIENCRLLIISDKSDIIQAAIYEGRFLFAPNLFEGIDYYLYGLESARFIDVKSLQKNIPLPLNNDWQLMQSFKFNNYTIPAYLK